MSTEPVVTGEASKESVVTEEVSKESVSKHEAQRRIQELKAELERREKMDSKGPSGAKPAATYTMLLDKSEAERLHPEHKVRWVNLRNDAKAQQRQASGYERIPEAEGGRQVGNLALFKLPAEEHARRVEQINKLNKDRLNAHNREVEAQAESVAKYLRDNHGLSVSTERILYRES